MIQVIVHRFDHLRGNLCAPGPIKIRNGPAIMNAFESREMRSDLLYGRDDSSCSLGLIVWHGVNCAVTTTRFILRPRRLRKKWPVIFFGEINV